MTSILFLSSVEDVVAELSGYVWGMHEIMVMSHVEEYYK